MLHGLFLGAGGNHLLAGGGFGGHFAAHLVGTRVELGLLHALVLELQRVAHLLGGQFFGQQAVHAAAVLGGQVHLADLHMAQHDAVAGQAGAQFALDVLLDLGALGREDLAHRVAGKHLVDQALHGRLDDLGADVVGQVARAGGHGGRVQRVAHAQVQAEGQAFDRLQRSAARGLAHLFGAVGLVAQGEHAHAVQAGQHPHAAVAPLADRAGELVHPHTELALVQVLHRGVPVHHGTGGHHRRASDEPAHGTGRWQGQGAGRGDGSACSDLVLGAVQRGFHGRGGGRGAAQGAGDAVPGGFHGVSLVSSVCWLGSLQRRVSVLHW